MDFNINQQITVIGDPENSACAEVITALHDQKDFCIRNIDSPDDLSTMLQNNFRGFFIISHPSDRLNDWLGHFLKNGLRDYFSVYYYDSFFSGDLGRFMHLEFDFVIAGKQRRENLCSLLKYLTGNYWKKVPHSLLRLENGSMTNILRKTLSAFETLNAHDLDLDKIADKLNVSKSLIQQEIKDVIDMNFSDLKKIVFDYYRKNSPEYQNMK